MENEKTVNKKNGDWTSWCCGAHGHHWFLKVFLGAVIFVFVLTLGVAIGKLEGRHAGKISYGYAKGGNVMYFKNNERGRFGCAGGCGLSGTIQSLSGEPGAFFNTFTSPATGAVVTSGTATLDPYTAQDLAQVFTVRGTISKITAAKLTLTDAANAEKTVNIKASTLVKSAETDGWLSDLKTGDSVSIVTLPDANGVLNAELIRILAK